MMKNETVTYVSYPDTALRTILWGIGSGQDAVGVAVPTNDEYHPREVIGFVYRDGLFYTLPENYYPFDINASGDIVGQVFIPELGKYQPFVWTNWKPDKHLPESAGADVVSREEHLR
jgi:hypothetical protein